MPQPASATIKQPTGNEHGYVVLMSTIIVTSIIVAITVSLLGASTSDLQNGTIRTQSAASRHLADACAEIALQELKDTGVATASTQVTLPHGTCAYSTTSPTPETRLIVASAAVQNAIRKVKIEVSQVTPTLEILSWREVPDF